MFGARKVAKRRGRLLVPRFLFAAGARTATRSARAAWTGGDICRFLSLLWRADCANSDAAQGVDAALLGRGNEAMASSKLTAKEGRTRRHSCGRSQVKPWRWVAER